MRRLFNRAVEHHRAGRLEQAEALYRDILRARPDHPDTLHGLGILAAQTGNTDQALGLLSKAVSLKPDDARMHNDLGSALGQAGNSQAAMERFQRAVGLDGDFALAHYNLANAFRNLGRLDDALASYGRAVDLEADNAEFHWNLSLCLLQAGDFRRGWEEYEWRWTCADFPTPQRTYPQPLWRGEDLGGKTIFLHPEQGLGDTLQFMGFVPLVARRAERVVLECPPELARLAGTLEGPQTLVAPGEAPGNFDVHCPLVSLPLALGTTLETLPCPVPYLAAPGDLVDQWAERLRDLPGPKIGLVWSGNPRNRNNRFRKIDFAALAPLLRTPGVSFVSLQVGGEAENSADLAGNGILDLAPHLHDFAETAAAMANLDLIITTDTATPHLAGALGRPVWTLLHDAPDWRWFLNRDDCPWYPTMRLFRQEKPGEWNPVIERITAELQDQFR